MTHIELKNFTAGFLFCVAVCTFVFLFPVTGYGAGGQDSQFYIGIDVSPNIINIDSQRWGEIRILTNMRYSFYAANGHSIFIYFNDSDSVENIRATRDSLGNLILKFSLEDLLVIESWLKPNDTNDVKAVVSMDNGNEYAGQGEVYINKKR